MLPSPSSSPRHVLAPTTNITRTPSTRSKRKAALPPTPSSSTSKSKRRAASDLPKAPKRIKFDSQDVEDDVSEESDFEGYSDDSDEDVSMDDCTFSSVQARQYLPYPFHTSYLARPVSHRPTISPSTLPILQSFVSSHKSDVFKCQSAGGDTYLTPPYACSYSHSARTGTSSLLAVATEQGTVHVLDTKKKAEWDVEPPRITIQSHNNGVFDVKWNEDDSLLATCSGDQSTRITDITTGAITHVLQGHSSTVKCASWDRSNQHLLATGGRDGSICLWDLRMSTKADDDDIHAVAPVMTIYSAHEDTVNKSKPKIRRGKNASAPRTVTSLLYPDSDPYGLVSSSSYDGILNYWDFRAPATPKRGRAPKPKVPSPIFSSPIDPTTLHGSRRQRGIIALTEGVGPTRGLLFGLGADSRIHTYSLPTLAPQNTVYTHDHMQTTSFYVGISVSPSGQWLACGGTGSTGSSYVFDIENAGRPGFTPLKGIELKGQSGEVGALDWAKDQLATCADDGTVRVWRPDVEMRSKCVENPEENRWEWAWAL